MGGSDGWVNGNAGASQAHHLEGFSIPYRAVMESMPTDTPITVTLGYDIKSNGKHALDYLTHYDRPDSHQVNFGHVAETVDPTDGISGLSVTPSTFPILVPSSMSPCVSDIDGQPTASFNALPAGERLMTLFGGTITAISYPSEGCLTDANAETQISVTFTLDSETAVLAWGGHIAKATEWGSGNSAAGISGSSYHMSLIDWTLGNLGRTDRSLSTGAVQPVGNVVINKVAVGGNTTFSFDATGSGIPSSFSIDTFLESGKTFSEIAAGSKTVSEVTPQSGWDFTSLSCEDPSGGTTVDETSRTANIDLADGETVTCTFTNTKRGRIKLDKVTDPTNDPQLFDFTLAGGPDSINQGFQLADATAPHDSGLIKPRTYSASETVPAGWDLTGLVCEITISGLEGGLSTFDTTTSPPDASITLAAGDTVTCTFTNTQQKGQLTVTKATLPATDASTEFDVTASGDGTITETALQTLTGNAGTFTWEVTPGTYAVSEAVPAGWDETNNTCVGVAVAAGETGACTITNVKRGTLIIQKHSIGGAATFSFTGSGPQPGSLGGGFDITTNGEVGLQSVGDVTFGNIVAGGYAVAEVVPDGWTLASATCSNGNDPNAITLGPGQEITCTFVNVMASVVTNSALCRLNVGDVDGQFRLIYIQDPQAPGSFRLNSSNPGQFYYNVFADGPDAVVNLTIDIPYPFVTQGANPIQVHDGILPPVDGCLVPGPSPPGDYAIATVMDGPGYMSSSGNSIITFEDYVVPEIGQTTTVTVSGPLPPSGLLYVTIHLDYSFKKTTGWEKKDSEPYGEPPFPAFNLDDPHAGMPPSVTIDDPQEYSFSWSDDDAFGSGDTQTAQSINAFKKYPPGISGIVTTGTTLTGTTAVEGVTLRLYDPDGLLVGEGGSGGFGWDVTDEDGWYQVVYKHKGKRAFYTVQLTLQDGTVLTQQVQLKGNAFRYVFFEVPESP